MTRLRNNWRAGYAETCTSGSEGGSQKPGLGTDKGARFLPYKSTSATNIALGITGLLRQVGAKNPRVLLIDTDSQSHATLVTTGRNDFDTTSSLYSVLMANRQSAPQQELLYTETVTEDDMPAYVRSHLKIPVR